MMRHYVISHDRSDLEVIVLCDHPPRTSDLTGRLPVPATETQTLPATQEDVARWRREHGEPITLA